MNKEIYAIVLTYECAYIILARPLEFNLFLFAHSRMASLFSHADKKTVRDGKFSRSSPRSAYFHIFMMSFQTAEIQE
jgi:hypothetical protein